MKLIKKLFIVCAIVFFGLGVYACGEEDQSQDQPQEQQEEQKEQQEVEEKKEIAFSENETDVEVIKAEAEKEYLSVLTNVKSTLTSDQLAVFEVKYQEILTKVDALNGNIDTVKEELNTYYQELLKTVDLVKTVASTFKEQKDQALAELKTMYDAIAAVANETTLEYVKSLYDQAVAEINNLTESAKDQIPTICNNFATAAKEYVTTIASEALTTAIQKGREELKKVLDTQIAKIENADLKTKVQALYNELDLKIAGIIDEKLSEELIKQYLTEFGTKVLELIKEEASSSLETYKALAIKKVTELYNQYKDKITVETIQKALKDFCDGLVANINNSQEVKDVETIYNTLETKVKEYIQSDVVKNLIKDYQDKLDALVKDQIAKIPYTELKSTINDVVATAKAKLDGITDLDQLKQKFNEIKASLPTDIANVVKEHAEKLLAEAKTNAKQYINDELTKVIDKVNDADIKTKLNNAKTKALEAIDKIKDIESYETTIEQIKKDFVADVTEIVNDLVKKVVEQVKPEATKLYNAVYAKLSETSQTAFKTLYDNYLLALSKINDVENAAEEAKKATEQFLTDSKTYLDEALKSVKDEAIKKIDEKYNEYSSTIDIESYVTEFNTLYNNVKNAINSLSDISTIADDAATKVTDYIKDAIDVYTKYLKAKAEQLKKETLEKGKTLYDGLEDTEEFKNLGTLAKITAKATIKTAYNLFKTTIENLTPAVGAQKVCDEAYNAFVDEYNKALGITTE